MQVVVEFDESKMTKVQILAEEGKYGYQVILVYR